MAQKTAPYSAGGSLSDSVNCKKPEVCVLALKLLQNNKEKKVTVLMTLF